MESNVVALKNNSLMKQKIEDFKILEDIINERVSIDDLGEELQERLILLCKERKEEVEKKIKAIEEETEKLESFLYKIDC